MKITTWNVNSIHARLPWVTALLARHQPDVACLQEIKASPGEFPAGAFATAGYQTAVHGPAGRNGVAVLARSRRRTCPAGFPAIPFRTRLGSCPSPSAR